MLLDSNRRDESHGSAARLQAPLSEQDAMGTNLLTSLADTNSMKSEISFEGPNESSEWASAIDIPGSRKKKVLYLGAKVQSTGCDTTICNQMFRHFCVLLNATINSRQHLRDDLKLRKSTSYHLYMVGTTPETARPSVVVFCKKEYSEELRSLFGQRLQGQLNCNPRGLRNVVHRFKRNQLPTAKFNLVCFHSDLNPVDRKISTPCLPYKYFPKGRSESSISLEKVFEGSPMHWAGVFLVSSIRGILKGHILASQSMLGSIPGDEPCRAWTVILDPGTADVLEGEYGSLIIDQKSNEVYGHVIGCGPLGQVYVSPMKQESVQSKTRSKDKFVNSSVPTLSDPSREWSSHSGLDSEADHQSQLQRKAEQSSVRSSQSYTVKDITKMASSSQQEHGVINGEPRQVEQPKQEHKHGVDSAVVLKCELSNYGLDPAEHYSSRLVIRSPLNECAASSERTARYHIREALGEAHRSRPPITDLPKFLELVKEFYLAPKLYKMHENVVIEMWSEALRPSPPTPAASIASCSPNSEASNPLGDNFDNVPLLDAEAGIDSVWLAHPTNGQYYHATYQQSSNPGSYIRADSMQDRSLQAGENEIVVIQLHLWLGGSENDATIRTACRIVKEKEAESVDMKTDLVLGTDHKMELEQQAFSVLATS